MIPCNTDLRTARAERSCGGGQEGSQTHSEPEGVVEGARRAAKRTQIREEWWRGPGEQPNTLKSREEWWRGLGGQANALRAGRSSGGG